MHAVLEYLAVGILLVVVILAADLMIEAPPRTIETVSAEQLYTVAERLIDKILLTPGYPENWGSDLLVDDEITDFGLALHEATAPYILDPDKVMRLANLTPLPNPMPINAEKIAELLGIKGKYGFKLEMRPMITAKILAIDDTNYQTPLKFWVQVVNWQGIGLPNARVTGMYIMAYFRKGTAHTDLSDLKTISETCITDALGSCVLDFSDQSQDIRGGEGDLPAVFIIIHIEWEGFTSVTGYSPVTEDEPVYGYIIGNYVFIERLEDATGAVIVKDEIVQAVPLYSLLLEPTEVEWCRAQPNDPMWCHEVAGRVLPSRRNQGVNYLIGKVAYLERLSSHVMIFGQWKGRRIAVAVCRIPVIEIGYGGRAQPANAVTVTRVAQIYNYPYLVRLTIWRLVEGSP
ncbi:MAG: hypothetical protein QW291_09700 [Thermofilaceae archaeon]